MGSMELSMEMMVERRIDGAMERWREESQEQHNHLKDQM